MIGVGLSLEILIFGVSRVENSSTSLQSVESLDTILNLSEIGTCGASGRALNCAYVNLLMFFFFLFKTRP